MEEKLRSQQPTHPTASASGTKSEQNKSKMSSAKETMYKKRSGTSGMSGQLYEAKLISLVLFRLLHDDRFEEFYLASNLDEIGCFDDLCFKAKLKGIDKPLLVFIQAKHKDDPNSSVDFDEAKHFHDSYSRVVQNFYLNSKDKNKSKEKIFSGKFEDNECIFILYTNGRYNHDSGIDYDSKYAKTLNDLVATGKNGTTMQFNDKIVEESAEAILKEEIAALAEHFTKFLNASQSLQMMIDDYVQRYHVVLATKVVEVSEVHCDEKKVDLKWRILKFREDFFETEDKHLMLLKKDIFKRILKSQVTVMKNKKPDRKQKIDPELEEQLNTFFKDPSAKTLSTLIGTYIEYKDKKLEFICKRTESDKQRLNEVNLSQNIIEEAEAIAAKNILEVLKLKVPVTFGNTDLMISERRIDHLTKNIVNLCMKFELENGYKIVTLDETAEKGLLAVNGGLAGAVGNLLVYDDNTKLLKFIDDSTLLANNAAVTLEKLKINITDLHEYRLYVKPTLPFPKHSFDCSGTAKAILQKLIIYAQQSDQAGVEAKLKNELEEYRRTCSYGPHIQVETEVLLQTYHGNVQAWWMLKKQGPYLTKDSKIFEEALNNIITEPQISSLKNTFHMTKMLKIEHKAESLEEFQDVICKKDDNGQYKMAAKTIFVTNVITMTAIKIIQYLRYTGNNNYAVLDLDSIFNLSTRNYCALKAEVKKTDKILIIVCDNLQSSTSWLEVYFKEIGEVVENKQIILITDKIFVDMVRDAFSPKDKKNEVQIIYEKHKMADLTKESRRNAIEDGNLVFEGQVASLNMRLEDFNLHRHTSVHFRPRSRSTHTRWEC